MQPRIKIKSTRTQRLRALASRKRAMALAATSKPSPDSLVAFLCSYGDVSHVVLQLLSVGDIGRLECSSKHLYHGKGDKSSKINTNRPLRSDIVWRQLWCDAALRTTLEHDSSWLKSSWGKRAQPTDKSDPTTLPLSLFTTTTTTTTTTSTTSNNRRTSSQQSPPTAAAAAAAAAAPVTWRSTYRAASVSWSRRRSGKMFKKLRSLRSGGATSQSLQRVVASCRLKHFEVLVNGLPLRVFTSTKNHARLWSSDSNRVGATLSSDGARFFSSSMVIIISLINTDIYLNSF